MEREKKSTLARLFQVVVESERRKMFIYFAFTTLLWLFGSWNISFAWIILFLSMYLLGEHRLRTRKEKKNYREMNETKSLPASLKVLPDGENAIWLNNILNQMWPYIGELTQNALKEIVEPEIQKKLPAALKSLYFEKIDLGQKPPLIGNVKSYARSGRTTRASELIIDVDVTYNGDGQVKLALQNVKLGISDFQVRGPLRIILKPLLSNYTLVGGITVFFLKRPKIAFDLKNLLNVLDFPGLKKTLRGIVDDVIAGHVVLPNRIAIPLAGSVDATDLRYPIPEGVLRVAVVEARELMKSDSSLIGNGNPDPYVILEVGAQTFRTETKKNDSNPEWNETFEAFVDNSEGQELDVYLYDRDLASKDSKIGNADTKLHSVVEEGARDLWLPLEGKQGKIHLKLEWFSLSSDPLHFRYTQEKESVAVLIVKLIKAENFPAKKFKSVVTRKVFCKVTVGDVTLESFNASEELKEWKQTFRFLLDDPHEEATIEMMESSFAGNKSLGSMTFVVRKLIEEPDMAIQDSFPLENCAENGRMVCKFTLRALKSADCTSVASFLQLGHNKCFINGNVSCLQRASPTMIVNAEGPECASTSESDSSGTTGNSGSGSSPSGSIADGISTGHSSEDAGAAAADATKDYTSRGELTLKLIYDHRRNRLVVTVLGAKDLSSPEPVSKTNPYVQVSLLPSRSKKSLRKTLAFPGSVNPVFNESFEYVIGLDQLADKWLDVAVRNERLVKLPVKGRDVIGCTTIKLCELSLSPGVTMNCELTK